MANARHISRTETAKIIRKALKREFPNTKFSVRSESYSGGGSITTQWVDGPTEKQVEAVIGAYEGKGFDGMVDLSYYYDAWLTKDGQVSIAKCQHLNIDNPPPTPDAELVHFGSGYLSTKRFHSPTFVRRVAAEISEQIGWDAPEIIETTSYWSRTKQVPTAYFQDDRRDDGMYREFANALYNTAADEPAEAECVRSEREYKAWQAEQEQAKADEDDQEINEDIHAAEIADIAANRAANDAQALETEPEESSLRDELDREIRLLAAEIIQKTGSEFIRRCVARKIDALRADSSIKEIIKVGDDLMVMAKK